MESIPRRPLLLNMRGIAGTLLAFTVAAACVRLGVWQLSRRAERAQQNDRLEARLAEAPARLSGTPADSAGLQYRRVSLTGTYDVSRSIILPGRALRGTPGVHVVTPVMLGDGGAILVNRGWLPSPDAATVDLSQLPATGIVVIDGIALPIPGADRARATDRAAPGGPGAAADTFRRVWYAPDETALRAQFPYALGAVLVQALPADDAPPFPERLDPPPLDPGPHLGYAIQWFSFATIAIGGWFVVVLKGRATPPEIST